MDFFTAMEVSASALDVERVRMNIASANLANARTTRTAEGGPYQRQNVLVESATPPGSPEGSAESPTAFEVKVQSVESDPRPPRLEYDPSHPDADANGYVAYPNVSPVEEIVDMITASRAYEAGVTAIKTASTMAEGALQIGK
ncbi:MAG: flagellar basal body rod protein FlgC [Myxococcota bacterium]